MKKKKKRHSNRDDKRVLASSRVRFRHTYYRHGPTWSGADYGRAVVERGRDEKNTEVKRCGVKREPLHAHVGGTRRSLKTRYNTTLIDCDRFTSVRDDNYYTNEPLYDGDCSRDRSRSVVSGSVGCQRHLVCLFRLDVGKGCRAVMGGAKRIDEAEETVITLRGKRFPNDPNTSNRPFRFVRAQRV